MSQPAPPPPPTDLLQTCPNFQFQLRLLAAGDVIVSGTHSVAFAIRPTCVLAIRALNSTKYNVNDLK